MLQTYKATLQGNQLHWSGDSPKQLESGPIEVLVTVLTESETETERATRGKRMAEALEKLAESKTVADISDPVMWQREQRQDRDLPGRDN
jgi:hypothetical protein